jgi:MFS family permease
MVMTLLISSSAYLLFGLATSLPLIFLARIIGGIAAGNISVASAYIVDITDVKNRTQALGLISAAFSLGFIFGPAIGGLLSVYGFNAPAFAASGLSFLAAMLALVALPESLKKESSPAESGSLFLSPQSYAKRLKSYRINILLVMSFLVSLGTANVDVNLPLFADRKFALSTLEIGLLFALTGVCAVLSQTLLVGKLSHRISEATIMLGGGVTASVSFLLLVASYDFLTLSSTLALASVGLFMGYPLVRSMISKAAPPGEQGTVLGLSDTAGSLGFVVGPILVGISVDVIGVDVPFLVTSGIAVFLFLLALKVVLSQKGRASAVGV